MPGSPGHRQVAGPPRMNATGPEPVSGRSGCPYAVGPMGTEVDSAAASVQISGSLAGRSREDGAMRQVAWAAGLLLAACYPGGAETVEDLDSVITQHDASASFSTLRTYALPDSIQGVTSGQGQPLTIDHSYDAQILARVASNLNAKGLQQVDPTTTTPDVDVLVSFTLTRYVEYVSYPFYDVWPGWPGFDGYDGSWGVYYPYAAAYTVLDAGTLRIDMLDNRTPNPTTKQLTAIWNASMQGVPGSDLPSYVQRLEKGIDQAFAQSPYL